MSIMIGRQSIKSADDLSPKASAILSFITNGNEWLERQSINTKGNLSFSNEHQFLQSILHGVFGSSLIHNITLDFTAGIERLFQFSTTDLTKLKNHLVQNKINTADKKVDAGSNSDPNLNTNSNPGSTSDSTSNQNAFPNHQSSIHDECKSILSNNNLLSDSLLVSTLQNANKTWLGDNARFMCSNIEDYIQLYQLTQKLNLSSEKEPLISNAISFAESYAQNFNSFLILIQIYIVISNNPIFSAATTKSKNQQTTYSTVLDVFDFLVPIIENNLSSPHIPSPPGQNEIHQVIKQWQNQGHNIGFSDLYSGVLEVTKYCIVSSNTKEGWQVAANSYIDVVQRLIHSTLPSNAELSQDGKTWMYFYDDGKSEAVVNYAANQCIAISSLSNGSKRLALSNE